MMTTFEQREQSFEAKFHHDLDIDFRVRIRRDKLLGLWAGELMDMSAPAAKSYAANLVDSDCGAHRDNYIFDTVMKDLRAAGVEVSDHRLRRRMSLLLDEARRQIMAEDEASLM